MLKGSCNYLRVEKAVILALELAKWYTIEKTEDDIISFLKTKTDDLDLMKVAIGMWLEACN